MQNLEEMQQRNQGLPGVNSRTRFQDFNTKFELFNKQNLFNVSNLVEEQVVKKPIVKKMTQNQYVNLLKYIEESTKTNLKNAARDRYKTAERPNFAKFQSEIKKNNSAWEDYSYNPRTTKLLIQKIKADLSDG